MRVVVEAFGALRRYLPDYRAQIEMELPDAAVVADVLTRLGIPDGDVGLIAVNDCVASETSSLTTFDRVEIYAPMGGG